MKIVEDRPGRIGRDRPAKRLHIGLPDGLDRFEGPQQLVSPLGAHALDLVQGRAIILTAQQPLVFNGAAVGLLLNAADQREYRLIAAGAGRP